MIETRSFSDHVVTPQGQISAEVIVQGETIAAVEPKTAPPAGALDWRGDVLIPGLVDIHTDNLEKH